MQGQPELHKYAVSDRMFNEVPAKKYCMHTVCRSNIFVWLWPTLIMFPRKNV